MKNRFRETFKIARMRQYQTYWTIVASCGFVLALGLSLALRRYFHFEFHDNYGIVGWISANRYPKQQEMFYYISALLFVPLFTAVCWIFWLAYSTAILALTRFSLQRILKQDAFTYLPFLLVLKDLRVPELSVGKVLWMPLLLMLAAKLILLFYNFIYLKATGGEKRQQESTNGKLMADGKNTNNQRSAKTGERKNFVFAGNVLTSGLCIGFYLLIAYLPAATLAAQAGPPDTSTVSYSLKILLLTASGALVFWMVYSLLISRLLGRPFQNILSQDNYAYTPAVLLLLVSVLYPHGKYILLIFFLSALFCLKLMAIFIPQRLDNLNRGQFPGRILSYLMIPGLIYVFLYGGGNVNWGIDLFHEGERLAPLNELLRGKIPFRDIYIQHGLFQNAYRPLLASKLFGENLASVRFLEGLFGPLGYVCIYLLGLQVFKKRLTAILVVLIVSGQNFWVADRYSLGLIGIALVASYITKRQDFGLFAGWRPLREKTGKRENEKTRDEEERKDAGKGRKGWRGGMRGKEENGRTLRQEVTTFKPYPSPLRETVAICLNFGWKLILAGIITSLAFFYSTEIGLYTLATCGLFLFLFGFTQRGVPGKKRPLPLFCYGAGVFLGFLPFAVYFGLHGALDDLIRNSYIQCAYQIPIWGLQFPPLSSFIAQLNSEGLKSFLTSENFRWYLPVLLYLIATTYLLHRALQGIFWSSEFTAKLLLLLLAGVIFFRTALGRSDSPHLIYGTAMMWFVWVFFLERGILWKGEGGLANRSGERNPQSNQRTRITHGVMKTICILIPLVISLWYVFAVHHPIDAIRGRLTFLTKYRSIQRNVPESLKRAGGIQLPADQVSQVQQVVNYIQSNVSEDETIFDFSSQGAYYFFANRPSATRYHQVAYAATKEMQEEVIRDLERDKTKLVIFRTGGWFDNIDGVPAVDRHPVIARYLDEHYGETANINGTVILRRRGE